MTIFSRSCAAAWVVALASCSPSPFGNRGHRLTVEVVGNGLGFVTSTPAFINCPGACTLEVPPNLEVTLNASASVAGSTFVGWSGPCSGLEPCRLPLAADQNAITAIAAFALRNSLVVTRVGGGSGAVRSEPEGIDCGNDCSELFAPETEVTLAAAPEAGSTFEGWSGACAGMDACVISAAQAQLVTATFAPIMVPLTVELVGRGQGNIASTPPGLNCATGQCVAQFRQGTQVTLRANNGFNSAFTEWSGACSGTVGFCTFILNGPTSLTARFDPFNSFLSISPSTVTLRRGERFTFVALGGTSPYVFSVLGNGVVEPSGLYTAPTFETPNEVVQVRDARGALASATVHVISGPLAITPATLTLARDQRFTFVATGGASPYQFSIPGPILAGNGSVDATGRYTAPPFDSTAVVRVTDGRGAVADAMVTVRGVELTLTPTMAVVSEGGTFLFTAMGGVPPYAFVVLNGPGRIDSGGLFTAQPYAGTATVRVLDSVNDVADSQVTISSAGFDGGADGG